jgi:hypothetical protein
MTRQEFDETAIKETNTIQTSFDLRMFGDREAEALDH